MLHRTYEELIALLQEHNGWAYATSDGVVIKAVDHRNGALLGYASGTERDLDADERLRRWEYEDLDGTTRSRHFPA